jgi:hypothetical protein
LLLEKRDRAADLAKLDRSESAKVRVRAGGRCEARELVHVTGRPVRCSRLAAPGNHHLISGSGRRNRGESILAAHRIAVCAICHQEITGRVLVPMGTQAKQESAATVIYQRVR